MPSTVSLARCATYERADLRRAVHETLNALPELPELLARGKRVLLKPNLLSSNDPPEAAINTHPEFLRAVAEFFLERGCKVFMGDSCGSLSAGSTNRAIVLTGVDRVAAEVGAQVVDFDRAPTMDLDIPSGRRLRRIRVPKLLHEVDLFVTLPKLKTHGLTLLTGAVKNQLGLIPGKGKKNVHLAAPRPDSIAEAMVDIYSVVRPHLAIMDGVVGMEGNGPAAGRPRPVGLVLASADCVALDAVMGEIMGYEPGEVATTRMARERGLGAGRLEDIRVAGVPLDDARIPGYLHPPLRVSGAFFKMLPAFVIRWMYNNVGGTYATVMDDRCVLCGECVANCPAQAMVIEGKRLRISRAQCISCYCCSEVCQRQAIKMRRPLGGSIIYGLVHLVSGRSRKAERLHSREEKTSNAP